MNPFDNDEDVLVGRENCGNSGMGGIVMVRLRDGVVTSLTDPGNEAYPHHVSTRDLDRPAWAYANYYHEVGTRFDDEVIAVKLDGSKSVQRFVHKHSLFSSCYGASPTRSRPATGDA